MKDLIPQGYLTEQGVQIFNDLVSCIDDKILQSNDSFGLSLLANNIDLNWRMADYMNKYGAAQETKTGYSQVRAEWTVYNKTSDWLSKNMGSYGLTPEAREKLKEVWAKKEKKKAGLGDIMPSTVSTT